MAEVFRKGAKIQRKPHCKLAMTFVSCSLASGVVKSIMNFPICCVCQFSLYYRLDATNKFYLLQISTEPRFMSRKLIP